MKDLLETSPENVQDALEKWQKVAKGADVESMQSYANDEMRNFLSSFNSSSFSEEAVDATNETLDDLSTWIKEKQDMLFWIRSNYW